MDVRNNLGRGCDLPFHDALAPYDLSNFFHFKCPPLICGYSYATPALLLFYDGIVWPQVSDH
jgi:hypothetical protein